MTQHVFHHLSFRFDTWDSIQPRNVQRRRHESGRSGSSTGRRRHYMHGTLSGPFCAGLADHGLRFPTKFHHSPADDCSCRHCMRITRNHRHCWVFGTWCHVSMCIQIDNKRTGPQGVQIRMQLWLLLFLCSHRRTDYGTRDTEPCYVAAVPCRNMCREINQCKEPQL